MSEQKQAVKSREVTPLELFFDLVFVFAVSQLSHHLLDRLDWTGVAQTIVLLIGVFGVWSYTSFEATVLEDRRSHVHRMLLLVMLGGLFMNAAIGRAFDDGALAFVLPMLAIQLCRTLFSAVPAAPTSVLRQHYQRLLGWILVSAPLWLAGAWAPPAERLWWWVAAAGIDLAGTWLAHPWPGRRLDSEEIPFDAEHMMERLRLFLIIALGEVVLSSGAAIANAHLGPLLYFTGACALVVLVALWALYFSGSDRFVSDHLESTTNPILAARLAVNGEVLVVGGLIALAAAIEVIIAHPSAPLAPVVALLVTGGVFAYLLVQVWYLRFVTGRLPFSRTLAALALVPLGIAAPYVAGAAVLGLLALLLLALWFLVERENRTAPASAYVDPR